MGGSVYSAVRTDPLYTADYISSFKGQYWFSSQENNFFERLSVVWIRKMYGVSVDVKHVTQWT